jgi:hypothetical protein
MNAEPTATGTRRPADRPEFYVGYLPVPMRLRRWLRRLIPLLAGTLLIIAVLWSGSFRSPGRAVWNTRELRELTGLAVARPYAMVRVADATAPGGVRSVLLVQEGKRGAADLLAELDGKPVRARGHILQRDTQQLLELVPGGLMAIDALPVADTRRLHDITAEPIGAVTLRGEIIDPKCYLGAMKPGEGRTHKECAILCITGGIPPMFVTYDPSGRRSYYLLTGPNGGPADPGIRPFVADPVEVRGHASRLGDLTLLVVRPDDFSRL